MELKQSEPETLWQRFSLPEEERDPWGAAAYHAPLVSFGQRRGHVALS
jgi:hypothetical protein